MKIYISGPVTGIENYQEHFQKAEEYWQHGGFSCINPAAVLGMMPEDTTYEEYMKLGITLLEMCDTIYMLKGWEKSCGANRELGYALAAGITVLKEGRELEEQNAAIEAEKTKEHSLPEDAEKSGGGTKEDGTPKDRYRESSKAEGSRQKQQGNSRENGSKGSKHLVCSQ